MQLANFRLDRQKLACTNRQSRKEKEKTLEKFNPTFTFVIFNGMHPPRAVIAVIALRDLSSRGNRNPASSADSPAARKRENSEPLGILGSLGS